jgi:hypothetical protein
MSHGVSILIPTMFDSRYVIEIAIKSIKRYTSYSDYKIIVADAGVDEETHAYLSGLNDITFIKATDWMRPKDDLADAVDTDYYITMHDDVRVFKDKWIENRLKLMNKDDRNAIVGTVTKNYGKDKRFFPLGLMVKTSAARELGLKWGKQPDEGHDTGSLAYKTFSAQKKYKFVTYKFTKDIHHYAQMTWPKYKNESNYDKEKLARLMKERDEKMREIRHLLDTDSY